MGRISRLKTIVDSSPRAMLEKPTSEFAISRSEANVVAVYLGISGSELQDAEIETPLR
jgi:hypothetical protein